MRVDWYLTFDPPLQGPEAHVDLSCLGRLPAHRSWTGALYTYLPAPFNLRIEQGECLSGPKRLQFGAALVALGLLMAPRKES